MKYTIVHDPTDEIVMVTLLGEVDLGSISAMMKDVAVTLTETGFSRVLVNVLQLENKLSLIEMLTLSGMLQGIANDHNIDLKSLRRAMVSQKNGAMLEVYEIIAKYVGGPFERFQEIEQAKAWLTQ
jgi:hypothetical protein